VDRLDFGVACLSVRKEAVRISGGTKVRVMWNEISTATIITITLSLSNAKLSRSSQVANLGIQLMSRRRILLVALPGWDAARTIVIGVVA
jgi:hypothetical protein